MADVKSTLRNIEPVSTTSYNVGRLQTWLDYELSGMVLFFLSYFTGTIYLAALAAVVFIPFLLKVLFVERRFGWMITFFLFVAVPSLISYFLLDDSIRLLVAGCVSLGFFYAYCGLLRLVIQEWRD